MRLENSRQRVKFHALGNLQLGGFAPVVSAKLDRCTVRSKLSTSRVKESSAVERVLETYYGTIMAVGA